MKKCKSIVLIDDNALENHVNNQLIQDLGIAEKVEVLLNGLTAIEYLKTLSKTHDSPSLIFVDLNMSVMSGFDFLKEFHLLPYEFIKDIKVIVLTSSVNEDDYENAKSLGCDGYLIKPLTREKIKQEFDDVFYYE